MNRPIARYLNGLLTLNNWSALVKSFYVYINWIDDYLIRYIFGLGPYPKKVALRAPCGAIFIEAKCHEDLFTITEIFAMECYKADSKIKTFLDLGGNIGVASAYFLSRNNFSRGIIFEPLQSNINRLKINLQNYEERIEIIPKAVWIESGLVNFGVEKTGRYCGIGIEHPQNLSIEAENINDALAYCVDRLGTIEILKVDIEGAGVPVLKNIHDKFFDSIPQIMIEEPPFDDVFLLSKGYKKAIFDATGLFYYKK
jgi:FkbM family methyltransferase